MILCSSSWLAEAQVRAFRQWFALGVAVLCICGRLAGQKQLASELTVHEWGTFTAILGSGGQAVEWVPARWPVDLPNFVEHLSDASLKAGLRGTIRMETPVLYFYSAGDVTVSVDVSFSRGVITEWYPHATRIQPDVPLLDNRLSRLPVDGRISWNHVRVTPNAGGEFPQEPKANHYYYARQTSSSPLTLTTVRGEQQEKFLFYRGVSAARLPLQAEQNSQGQVLVRNLSEEQIPAIVYFERRGERVGYRLIQPAEDVTSLIRRS